LKLSDNDLDDLPEPKEAGKGHIDECQDVSDSQTTDRANSGLTAMYIGTYVRRVNLSEARQTETEKRRLK
jgi:hypothetical protein